MGMPGLRGWGLGWEAVGGFGVWVGMGGCLCGWLAVLAGEAPAGVGALGPPPGVRLCVATATVAGRRGGGRENALLYYMGGVRWFWAGIPGG
jgi:hypothetical protein